VERAPASVVALWVSSRTVRFDVLNDVESRMKTSIVRHAQSFTALRRVCKRVRTDTYHTVVASFRDNALLAAGISKDNRDDVARILEQAEQARDTWTVVHTAFYQPPVIADAMGILSKLADVVAVPWGGYPQAERQRVSLGREELMNHAMVGDGVANNTNSVALVRVLGNFMFDPADHRDFLGAVLGTGIERSVVGDILVYGDKGADVLVVPAIVDHLEMALTSVRTVPVTARLHPLSDIRLSPPRVLETTSVEASLRLDAVASAGFRTSRSSMTQFIKTGDVRVNWREVKKPALEVAEGDVISCLGKGRVEIKGITSTKKGKWAVQMARYV
jgi:photosystem II S4 domain protein